MTQIERYDVSNAQPLRDNFTSFQAQFYELGSEIGKVYRHNPIWDGVIPLDEPAVRTSIIFSEIQLLNELAPQLNARLAVLDTAAGEEEAIVMRRLWPHELLEYRLNHGEEVPDSVYEELGQKVANYHFNPELCPPVPSTSIDSFLSSLMRQEIQILEQRFPEDEPLYRRWDMLMQQYIQKNAPLLIRRQQLLGEPVLGHGDTKINNIIITEEGVGIMDPAPVTLWRINERRMDAFFMASDLELSGHKQAADTFWNSYMERYNQHVAALNLAPEDEAVVTETTPVMDLITSIYRFGIFYRLAKAGSVDPEVEASQQTVLAARAERAKTYVENGYHLLSQQLAA